MSVEHVGSTAVPGLAAKPIIDIDLAVADPADESSWLPPLEAAGFELVIREPWWHEHRALSYGSTPPVQFACLRPGTARKPSGTGCFRDWLREHPEDLALYRDAKLIAAGQANAANEHRDELQRPQRTDHPRHVRPRLPRRGPFFRNSGRAANRYLSVTFFGDLLRECMSTRQLDSSSDAATVFDLCYSSSMSGDGEDGGEDLDDLSLWQAAIRSTSPGAASAVLLEKRPDFADTDDESETRRYADAVLDSVIARQAMASHQAARLQMDLDWLTRHYPGPAGTFGHRGRDGVGSGRSHRL